MLKLFFVHKPSGHLPLKVPNAQFDFDVYVRHSTVNTYIEVKFDFEYSFARYDKGS